MDSIFLLGEGERAAFLQQMMQSFGCAYICLWSYLPPPSNCLLALDGVYREVSDQPSSSAGSLARRLFGVYRESVIFIDSGKLGLSVFRFVADRRVYGCATGEIELGMSNDPQADLQVEMKNLFPDDFSRQAMSSEQPPPTDPNQPPSSSSSSLRSLSVDSTEYSPLLFNIPTSSFIQEPSKEALNIGQTLLGETLRSLPISAPLITTSADHHQAAIQALSQIRNVQFPSIESEDSAMTKAILAVLSSPSSASSSCHQQIAPNFPPTSRSPTAFRSYPSAALAPVAARSSRKHSMFKRAVLFFRNLNMRRRQELQIQGNRPTTTQLHHMISERRRREKLNESFQILRSLLPPGSKKDKASVLSSTTEYLSSLKSQVEELSKRNQMLESQLAVQRSDEASNQYQVEGSSSSVERVNVEMNQVSSSSASEARFLDLRVIVRGETSMLDLAIRVLEFLKQQRNVSLLSVESNTRMLESIPVHRIMLRLEIEGDEFDESAFQEAVRRVVDDLPQS
ncbi:UNVERIFIED_CONTAM: putative transcription factor [Sesamum radiatum]|uniref:Transcription factor n=1 Tax=Sesamum radiatum TaxID=300843 RepID=A0AAW2KR26_SESRA